MASKGGNFLLDVGPTPEGTIQPEFVERLQAMGQWMKVNGDSIYGTTYGPLARPSLWQRPPRRARRFICMCSTGPSKPELELPALTSRVSQVTLLATGQKSASNKSTTACRLPCHPSRPTRTTAYCESRRSRTARQTRKCRFFASLRMTCHPERSEGSAFLRAPRRSSSLWYR